jgi:excisionase family DNA binding protein
METTERAPRLLKVDEAAKIMRLGRSSMYEAIGRGDLPSIRIGRRVLIPEQALLRHIAGDGWLPRNALPRPEDIPNAFTK